MMADYPQGVTKHSLHILQTFMDNDCETGKTAAELYLSQSTIRNTLDRLRNATGVNTTLGLIRVALREGWVHL